MKKPEEIKIIESSDSIDAATWTSSTDAFGTSKPEKGEIKITEIPVDMEKIKGDLKYGPMNPRFPQLIRRGPLKYMVTLWPSFEHFYEFYDDDRLSGIRLNSAMMNINEVRDEVATINPAVMTVPLFYDVKGLQLRIEEVISPDGSPDLEITLNHPISVKTPTNVLFKAGEDGVRLREIKDNGKRLLFDGWPKYLVVHGESLHIHHPSLEVRGPSFIESELEKIQLVKDAGFKRFFLSYVKNQRYVDEFLEIVGKDAEVYLKIEDLFGLKYVSNEFNKKDNLILVAACGDLYVEVFSPHHILEALKLIIQKDYDACVGSRMMLSVNPPVLPLNFVRALEGLSEKYPEADLDIVKLIEENKKPQIPSLADFTQLAWYYDLGYRQMMLCDEICLRSNLLNTALNALEAFNDAYVKKNDTIF